MKKIGIFMCSLALVGMVFTSCKPNDGKQDVDIDNIVEDGFYAVGEACPIKTVDASDAVKAQMAQGINEVLMDQGGKTWEEAKRDGMYEKFIWLEANKDFELILKEGANTTIYGADLKKDSLNTDKGNVLGYKGSLVIGQKMQVQESGLYHIVLDLNRDGALDLTGKEQIIVAPVNWALCVENSDHESKCEVKSPTEIVWTWEEVEINSTNWFKFKDFITGWKIVLDDAGAVKAHTNMGALEDDPTKLINGTGNLPKVDKSGFYKLTLTYTLAKGNVGDSYAYTIELVKESEAKDYSACELELVGSAVVGGIADPSSWGWGNVLSIGTPSIPTKDKVYTWRAYDVELKAGEGFKIRTINAEDNGGIAKFDYGTNGQNMTVPADGKYDIYFYIDAATDAKSDTVFAAPAGTEVIEIVAKVTGWANPVYVWTWNNDPALADQFLPCAKQEDGSWKFTYRLDAVAYPTPGGCLVNGPAWNNGQTSDMDLSKSGVYTITGNGSDKVDPVAE